MMNIIISNTNANCDNNNNTKNLKIESTKESSHMQQESAASAASAEPQSAQTQQQKSAAFSFGNCKVCGDRATGIHYGIASCEACKGFFKRCITKRERYVCFENNNCKITMKNRGNCKACRLRKCVQAGMSIYGIKMGRIPIVIKQKYLDSCKDGTNQQQILEWPPPRPDSPAQQQMHAANPGFSFDDLVRTTGQLDETSNIVPEHALFKILDASVRHDGVIVLSSLMCCRVAQIYTDFTRDILNSEKLADEAQLTHRLPIGYDTPVEIVRQIMMRANVHNYQRLCAFAEQLPGLKRLVASHFDEFIDKRRYEINVLKYSSAVRDDESYLLLADNFQYSCHWMKVTLGVEQAEQVMLFYKYFNSFRLTSRERALMCALLLTAPDPKESAEFAPLNDYYMRAILYEFDLNRRDHTFMNELSKLLAQLTIVGETFRKARMNNFTG